MIRQTRASVNLEAHPHRTSADSLGRGVRSLNTVAAAGETHRGSSITRRNELLHSEVVAPEPVRGRGAPGEACRFHYPMPSSPPPAPALTNGHALGSPHCNDECPMSPDRLHDKKRQTLQEVFEQNQKPEQNRSTTNMDLTLKKVAGWERPATTPLSMSTETRDAIRFHSQGGPPVPPRRAPEPVHSSFSARDACRYHSGVAHKATVRARSLTPDTGGVRRFYTQPEGKALLHLHAAGRSSDSHSRFDTPGGMLGAHARSMTPDYYRRYRENASGTSLPGAQRDVEDGSGSAPATPRSARRIARIGECNPRTAALTESAAAKASCHFHADTTAFGGPLGDSPKRNSRGRVMGSAFIQSPADIGEAGRRQMQDLSADNGSSFAGGSSGGSPAFTQWQKVGKLGAPPPARTNLGSASGRPGYSAGGGLFDERVTADSTRTPRAVFGIARRSLPAGGPRPQPSGTKSLRSSLDNVKGFRPSLVDQMQCMQPSIKC